MATNDVRVVTDERALRALSSSDDMRDLLMEEAEPVERRMEMLAPKRTGAGARSIRREPVLDVESWVVRISWTRDHYYLYFHDRGTVNMRATPFLEEALAEELL